jgi:glycosyltransferase involved in cell wall biosynthesis
MHILLISRCPPYPLYLGDRLILYHLARELSQRGHTLDLLAFDDRPDIPDDPNAYTAYFRHVEILPAPKRGFVGVFRLLLLPGTRFPERADASSSPAMWNAIQQRVGQNSYDLVHLFGGVQVYEYRHALNGLPAIITPYESYSLYLRRLRNSAGAQRAALQQILLSVQLLIASAFERFMFTPYARTVVVSQRDADELRALNPALNISVIPNGVDLEQLPPSGAAREAATLLFTGNYEYPPNVDAALILARDILPKVRATIPDVKLWLVGNAPPPELQALASDVVTVTGHVPDLRPYLAAATVFVCPLRLGAGIKNKVLEALALGLPVVATPLSVDGIAVENGRDALIAELHELPDAVIRLLRDPELQRTLATNGRALIEREYTWARVAEQYEALYKAVSR